MRKILLLIAVSILFGAGIWKGYQTLHTQQPIQKKQTASVADEKAVPRITLILVEEDAVATYSGVPASTVFDALQAVATEKNIPLKTKQYDFGIFVEEIGNKPITKDHAWLYFVNGISGDVAADKKILKSGDSVEWRYMKPTY